MSTRGSLSHDAKIIFNQAVSSVIPQNMVKNAMRLETNKLFVGDQFYKVDRNVHVVAFGKAVSGMVRATEEILGDHITEGIASVPAGLKDNLMKLNKMDLYPAQNSKVRLIEGARNNIPDEESFKAAKDIHSLVQECSNKDIIIVLISGGGSALLPYPHPPISMAELSHVTKLLSRGGASIQELNTVRKNLEVLKGGGLAAIAHPAKVVTLILSDIVGDPLDLIASGPTVLDKSTPEDCLQLFKDYRLTQQIPPSILKHLNEIGNKKQISFAENSVQNLIIGTNKIAVHAAEQKAKALGYIPYNLSTMLTGDARLVGESFAELTYDICSQIVKGNNDESIKLYEKYSKCGFSAENLKKLCEEIPSHLKSESGICLLGAGETTVDVRGSGKGGRNQEMALFVAILWSHMLNSPEMLNNFDIQFLSGGTDGQDGPTDAAGALVDCYTANEAIKQGIQPESYLDNNDAYSFFSSVNNGKHLLMTGFTGTNVMDVQMVLIKRKS